jgi:hypothetical protein
MKYQAANLTGQQTWHIKFAPHEMQTAQQDYLQCSGHEIT